MVARRAQRATSGHGAEIDEANALWGRLFSLLGRDPLQIDALLTRHSNETERSPKLLHLSDLHFGTEDAANRQTLLLAYATKLVKAERIKRVVITGDLFDQPKELHALAFSNFRDTLEMLTETAPILIPGNHDQKLFGNFRWSLKQLANLEWESVVIDDDLKMVLFCFDSSKDSNWAKGCVDEEQRRAVAAKYEIKLGARPELASYLKVALVHHHPYTFSAAATGAWKVFERIGIKQEGFLRMDDAESFVRWCAMRGANVILHGHKHVPYHVSENHQVGSTWVTVDSVGCGSSTGMGGKPMTLNIVEFTGRMWSVRTLLDVGDGSGLTDHTVKVQRIG